jgi:uncharacterized protein (UPF0332 family)
MDKRIEELSTYRMTKAKEDLEASMILDRNGSFSQAINRSYYAMFHAARALLAYEKFDSRKHSGIISYFNRHFIKTGEIEADFGRMLLEAERIRLKSDYDDFFISDRNQSIVQIEDARKFVARIEDYIARLKSHGQLL